MIDFITMPDFIRLAYIVVYTISAYNAYIITKLIAKAPVGLCLALSLSFDAQFVENILLVVQEFCNMYDSVL